MRGASALNDLLAEFDHAPLRVFVVWEPVIWSDIAPPTSAALRLVDDSRAIQYWDGARALSDEILRTIRNDPARFGFDEAPSEDFVVWDVVAVFPKGSRWDASPPAPLYQGAPVASAIGEARQALARAVR